MQNKNIHYQYTLGPTLELTKVNPGKIGMEINCHAACWYREQAFIGFKMYFCFQK